MPDERRLREQAGEAIERGKTSLSSRFGSPTTATVRVSTSSTFISAALRRGSSSAASLFDQ